MDPRDEIVLMEALEETDSSTSSEDDEDELLMLASIANELCDTETHAKIRGYIDDVVTEYSDDDVSIYTYIWK